MSRNPDIEKARALRQRILRALWQQERDDPAAPRLARRQLQDALGLPWDRLRAEVELLVARDQVAVERLRRGNATRHLYAIRPAGVEVVEGTEAPTTGASPQAIYNIGEISGPVAFGAHGRAEQHVGGEPTPATKANTAGPTENEEPAVTRRLNRPAPRARGGTSNPIADAAATRNETES